MGGVTLQGAAARAHALRSVTEQVVPVDVYGMIARAFPHVTVLTCELRLDHVLTEGLGGRAVLVRRGLAPCERRWRLALALGQLVYDGRCHEIQASEECVWSIPTLEAEQEIEWFAAELLAPSHLVAPMSSLAPADQWRDHAETEAARLCVPVRVARHQLLAGSR